MKKLVFMFAVLATASLVACGGKKADNATAEEVEATVVEEVTEEAVADSTIVVEEEVVVAE